jgi:hypothetical protein
MKKCADRKIERQYVGDTSDRQRRMAEPVECGYENDVTDRILDRDGNDGARREAGCTQAILDAQDSLRQHAVCGDAVGKYDRRLFGPETSVMKNAVRE